MRSARDLLDGFETGLVDAAEVTEKVVVVVDAGAGGDPSRLRVPVLFPAVVVVVASGAAPGMDPAGPDVALTDAPTAPPPWVTVADLGRSLGALVSAIRRQPVAATVLTQLLRVGHGAGTQRALAMESLAYSSLQAGAAFAEWRRSRPPPRQRPGGSEAVAVSRMGDRLVVELNRPAVHNAYNRAMRDALCEALAVARSDPSLSVEISGRGRSFCSGGDLDEFGTAPDPPAAHLVRTARSPGRLLAAVAERTTVTLHGACAGSGIELPAFAGTVRAREGTRIWLPELSMGLIPGAGGTASLPRRIGRGRTAWLALSGEVIDASTALGWGLVDAVLAG